MEPLRARLAAALTSLEGLQAGRASLAAQVTYLVPHRIGIENVVLNKLPLQGGHHLVRLDPGDDPNWYRPPRYHGVRARAQAAAKKGLQINLPGWCCTDGCTQTHDTACSAGLRKGGGARAQRTRAREWGRLGIPHQM